MNLSAPFIARPVATTLITFGIALAGLLAFLKLPVSPLPQVDGVGQVVIGGGALPGVRVELNPHALSKYGVGLEDVRAVASANVNSPKGAIEDDKRHSQIYTNDQATRAADYIPLIVAYHNGAPVHLTDVANVLDSVEDVRNEGLADGQEAVFAIIFRQPGANIIIIDTVERVRAELPTSRRLCQAISYSSPPPIAAIRSAPPCTTPNGPWSSPFYWSP